MTGAARMLGVHANTVRAWTDQGRLHCIRINERGDRRYRAADLRSFLAAAGIELTPSRPFQSRLRPVSPPRLAHPGGALTAATEASPEGSTAGGQADADRHADGHGDGADRVADGRLLASLAALAAGHQQASDLEGTLRAATRMLRDTGAFSMIAIAEWHADRLAPRYSEGSHRVRAWWQTVDASLAAVCCREGRPIAASVPATSRAGRRNSGPEAAVEVYAPIGGGPLCWGVLIAEVPVDGAVDSLHLDLLAATASLLALVVEGRRLRDRVTAQEARARAMALVSTDLASRLEVPAIMGRLVDHGVRLFAADRAAVFLRTPAGGLVVAASHGLSEGFIAAACRSSVPQLCAAALGEGHTLIAEDVLVEPRYADLREAARCEGLRSAAVSPLQADGETLGILAVYHDHPRAWSADDLGLLESLVAQAGVAVRNAHDFERMATWAAQLQSIQQLGGRLDRLATVGEIGHAICLELRQLIDSHNVRVYRVVGDDVVPTAWRGEIGEYTDEDGDMLRLKVGQGITGWVAQHGVAQYLPDASSDPRSQTIPGTEEDLDESMLLAPMRYDDRVIGVIVLSKLGLDRFTADDLRYLEIYASMAAQAIVNADSTEQLRAQSERLERQLESQRELIRVTESFLSTLDPRAVVEEIADRLGSLVRVDNLCLDVYDAHERVLRPLYARGIHADRFMGRTLTDRQGVAGWVVRHGEAQLVQDELADSRVAHFEQGREAGALIVAPLRGRAGITGVLTLERLGPEARFDDWEFELIQVFAGHVSIALANAVAHEAAEERARTDSLTGLKNQGTFQDHLTRSVIRAVPFGLLLVDLDDFKSFNDRHGHEAGNRLLTDIARGLDVACRESDEVFRYGGDEFALILPNTSAAGAMEVAARVSQAVTRAHPVDGVTCSIGVASFPGDASDRDALLLAADRACYVAKRSGRARIATAAEGLALAAEILPPPPTPVDELEPSAAA